MKKNFVHLHVHSEYSLLDGSVRIKDLISKAMEFGMPAIALTDHGVMYGIIEFYKTAIKSGIKPIIGCEIYQAPKSRWEKQLDKENREEVSNHLTLLVENKTGYTNLMKLVSLGFIEGFYYKPRVDNELLRQYKDGIIALSGCISGKVPRCIQNGKISEARKAIEEYIDIFGRDNFFLELQDSGIPEQKGINKALFELSKEFKIPVVCTNDVHYLNKHDNKSHDVLLCIQTGTTINEADRLKFPTSEYYFKDYKQMEELFKDFPGSVDNTIEIAERCNLELALNLSLIPPFKVPETYTPDEYLETLCREGSKKRYKEPTPETEDRITKELEVIKKMGFSEYFLIVWDLIKFAKNNNIRVGPGRGSAAGSIVSYLLNITDIEPLKYGLLFERFLNEERKNMPDIDIDFCYEKRDQVIKYVSKKYGENRVAQLITFGTMAARQAIRDAGRVLEVPYSEVDRIAKLVPMELNVTINSALELVPELKEIYNTNEKIREVIDTAISLEGMVRQDSIHAAGVVISAEDLYHYTPIQREGDTDIVTQYKMEDIQEIGLLKMDLLGLKTLSLIDKTLFLIEKTKGINLDIDNVSLDDKKTYEMLSTGDCLGVFQLESSGMRELVMNLKPTQFEDLVALLALYRPGPLQSGMVNDFVESKNKQKKIKYLHPSLEPILESTYGIILYQEQVMLIASKLAGFTMSEADILRDAIGKKKRKILGNQKKKFIEGAKKVGIIDADTAEKLFELVNHFAEYGFNKSHSTAYAMISYQTAYLKTNYPVEFMAALLSIRMGSQEKVAQYVNEARRMGINVLPPDINESFNDFTVVENSIRFGLSAIKNVGSNVIEMIVKERKANGRFSNFLDFCSRVSSNVLNKKTIESLIKSCTFDSLRQSRKYLLENYENIIEEINKIKKSRESGQFSLFEEEHSSHISGSTGESSADSGRESGQIYEEYSQKKLLNFEKEMLGLYVSGHPLAEFQSYLSNLNTIENLYEQPDKSTQMVGGVISKLKQIFTKSGQPMYFMTLEDLTDNVEVIVFPTVLEKFKELVEEDRIVIVKGRLDRKEDQIKLIAIELEDLKKTQYKKNQDFMASPVNTPVQVSEAGKENQYESDGMKIPKTEKIILNINKTNLDRDLINDLHQLIKENPGSSGVELRILNSDETNIEKTYSFPESYSVEPGDRFFKKLKEKFQDRIFWR